MPKIMINQQDVSVPEGMTVLQAATTLGIEIPTFCYHPKLSIAGNCRMCLVEMENCHKPIASCAMPVCEGMVIQTHTPAVKKARQSVLEFLLMNHPLDCPVCDQGGECDLQDIAVAYGRGRGRYTLHKRTVPDKKFGPLIETAMNRCIHCTRCIRFAIEIAGVPEIGAFGRGEDVEIGLYLKQAITSELSGNLVDICPVGALMSKPYLSQARPWELSHTPSIDVSDGVGSAIRIDTRGLEVMRILPRPNDNVNECWISDKARFSYDGLKSQRLDRPYVRDGEGKLSPSNWNNAFEAIREALLPLKGPQIAGLVGNLMDGEAMIAFKDLMEALGSPHVDCRQEGAKCQASPRCSYVFNTTLPGIEKSDFCLLIGTNPRWEAPLVNARIRKTYLKSGLPIALIGPSYDMGYPVDWLGNDPLILEKILKGTHPLTKTLKTAKHPMMILGQSVLCRKDGDALLFLAREIAEKYGFVKPFASDPWNGFNVLHTAASRVGGLDLGLVPGPKGLDTQAILKGAATGKIKAVYLLGVDEIDLSSLQSAFVIYQGHHGDQGASFADVILPGAAYSEKSGTYVNTEGRVQQAFPALSPPGEAREDWKIIRALSDVLGCSLPYATQEQVRDRMIAVNPLFEQMDEVQRSPWLPFGTQGSVLADPFDPYFTSFYMTDVISRHSVTMARCQQEVEKDTLKKI